MLHKLLTIDPSKKCLVFLHERILVDNYRGLQISQHNRYTYEQVVGMLEIFYDLVNDNKMNIRTTDLSKRPFNTPDEYIYAEYTNKVIKKYGKGTQDSIRKNLFVDFHRMGLISRFSATDESIGPYDRRSVSKVSLTNLAIDLINKEKTETEKYLLFTRALDNLMLGLATDFFDILASIDHLTIHEYTFFVSFIRQKLNGKFISLDDVIELVLDYRTLSRFQKNAVVEIVSEYCNPDNFNGSKTDKRDYHNWVNETQQVFMILNMTAYYQLNQALQRIEFMVSPNYVFTKKEDVNKIKRSIAQKKNYFKEHNINKTIGFELHHIVPLLWARNITEFFILDKWQNMLYIDGRSHSVITQKGNKHVKLKFLNANHNIILISPTNDKMELIDINNVLYSYSLKNEIFNKNVQLLNNF